MSKQEHWENVYGTQSPTKVGWFTPHLETSLKWIREIPLSKDANIIDVGGGVSTFVADLLNDDYRSVTVIDISKTALSLAKDSLGIQAESVTWLQEDITSANLPSCHYDLWHDRAVFHFLTAPAQQQNYLKNLNDALKPGGHLIIGTFAPEAPRKCSGLAVERYNADSLKGKLGTGFRLQRHQKELHITPGGVRQMYLYCHFLKST